MCTFALNIRKFYFFLNHLIYEENLSLSEPDVLYGYTGMGRECSDDYARPANSRAIHGS